jgi:glycosyltransferase involved in cell wall biosynthesis
MISVVLPVYRPSLSFLKESIDSILDQSYKNWELIIVMDKSCPEDDGKVLRVVSSYTKEHDNIKLIVNKDRLGISGSLNTGIMKARGKIIARMDSDDISKPERFEAQFRVLAAENLDFVGSWATLIDHNGHEIGEIRTPSTPTEIRKRLMIHNPFLHPTMMFLKESFLEGGLYDSRFGHSQDYELWMRLFKKGFIGRNIRKPLVKLRENVDSVTRGHGWFPTRLDYLLVKTFGFTLYRFRSLTDLLFLILSFLMIFVPPKATTWPKERTGMLLRK